MKCSIVISEGIKQVMFTPETESEKQALSMLTGDDNIEVAIKKGQFTDKRERYGYDVAQCQGGYLRAWENEGSTMLVLTPKKEPESRNDIDRIQASIRVFNDHWAATDLQLEFEHGPDAHSGHYAQIWVKRSGVRKRKVFDYNSTDLDGCVKCIMHDLVNAGMSKTYETSVLIARSLEENEIKPASYPLTPQECFKCPTTFYP